ncbi:MAG TPA: Nit6803 family nitrilase [Chthoniobacter sp.]|nr:Nit6803 family nitrilase [Chthoniobacter sp.]
MKRIRAAAVQIAPDLTNGTGTVDRVCDAIDRAAAKGVELAVFPETLVPYYPYFSFIAPPVHAGKEHMRLYEFAVEVPGPITEQFSKAAAQHGMALVIGVNERDGGSLYNAQLIFDADGTLLLKRRKITPTYHERMIWGQGDGSGIRAVNSHVGRVGALACWEHYNPLARFALMEDREEIHCAQFPGSMVGQIFADQIEVTIKHHALEAGCFVVNSTGWLTDEQIKSITPDDKLQKALRGGCYSAIISPEGVPLCPPITEGEGMAIAELDPALIIKRKRMMDSAGHYSRPDIFTLHIDRTANARVCSKTADELETTSYAGLPISTPDEEAVSAL